VLKPEARSRLTSPFPATRRELGMEVVSLVLPHLKTMCVRAGVVANSGHLPGDLHPGPVGSDRELAVANSRATIACAN
jgi:hypothetical protein